MKQKEIYFWHSLCFFYGTLISGSSAFSKSSLAYIFASSGFSLEANLKYFEHYLVGMWNECNCTVVSTFFDIAFLWDCNENWPFPVLCHYWVFQICWHIEGITLTASSFRILNRSAGIPLPALALFIVMFPKAQLTSHSRMSGSRWVTAPSWLSGSLSPSSTRLEARLPYHDSRAMTSSP